MRIRKEAIWPTECPVRTRYKGSPRPYDLAPFLLWIPCPSFSLIDPPRLVSLALVSPCFPTRSSSLNCESHVLESVGYVKRRENLIFRPEPGVPPRLDDPRYLQFHRYQFDGDTIPDSGTDSSQCRFQSCARGMLLFRRRSSKIRINKDLDFRSGLFRSNAND